jgi:hypothetical protein
MRKWINKRGTKRKGKQAGWSADRRLCKRWLRRDQEKYQAPSNNLFNNPTSRQGEISAK